MENVQTRVVNTETHTVTPVVPVTPHAAIPMAPSDEAPHTAYKKKKAIFKFYQIIWYILGVVEVLLAFRFFLKMLGSSPYSPFMQFINIASSPFAEPFRGVLPITQTNNNAFEWSTLIAMIFFLILTWGIVALAQFIKPTNPEEVVQTVDSVDATPPVV